MQDFDDYTNDDPEVEVDSHAELLRPAVHFDTGVEDALAGVDGIDELVDDVIAELPSEPVSPGPFPQTPGDLSGGAVTDELLGFLNGPGSSVAGEANDLLEQIQEQPELGEAPEGASGTTPAWAPPLPGYEPPQGTPDLGTIDPRDFRINGQPYPGDPTDPGYWSAPGYGTADEEL